MSLNTEDARIEAESALQLEFDKEEFTSTATCVRIVLDAALPHLTPRTITTMDEIYALTGGTILFDDNEQCSVKWFNERGETYLLGTGDDYRYSPADIELPARVLYTPSTTAEGG